MSDKVYVVGQVVKWEGMFVSPPIFGSVESAIRYMENVVIATHNPNFTFIRDDSILGDGEVARWYEERGGCIDRDDYYCVEERSFIE